MIKNVIYRNVLLDHFRHPRNRGELTGANVIHRGNNPRCGDEIEVGLFQHGETLDLVKFRGRGCSICIASASIMSEVVTGKKKEEAQLLCEKMQVWFGQGSSLEVKEPLHTLEALSSVRDFPARRRCVLIAWEALSNALVSI